MVEKLKREYVFSTQLLLRCVVMSVNVIMMYYWQIISLKIFYLMVKIVMRSQATENSNETELIM